MLEKLGLPAKPSLRGSNWVADASHCQGCSSQFTFINRKHHCRRCGGLFCNNCSRNRMALRGQGDSPVRICEPCKTLEEAARFQARYGRKKGGNASTSTQKDADQVQEQILCDNSPVTPTNPTLLREQAMDEKEKYKIFKSEGKADEALKAFKRGKELERRASAMELLLRKNQKKSGSSRSMKEVQNTSKNDVDFAAELRDLGWSDLDNQEKNDKQSPSLEDQTGSRKKTHVIDKSQVIALKKKALVLKRQGKLTEAMEELKNAKLLEKQLEEQEFLADSEESDDELTSLMRSIDNDSDDINQQSLMSNFELEIDFNEIVRMSEHFDLDNLEVTNEDLNDPEITTALENIGWTEDSRGTDSVESEIMSFKREALDRKKEGDIEGGKELLKKANLLENRSCLGSSEDEAPNGAMDVKPVLRSKLAVQKDLLVLKKKALALRREGRYADAEEELKKGRLLEQQLEDMTKTSNAEFSETRDEQHTAEEIDANVTDVEMHDPSYMKVLNSFGWQDDDDDDPVQIQNATLTSKKTAERRSKGEIQKELLGLKRKALALRRHGDVDAAEEVLKMAKILESEMADIESHRDIGDESTSIPSPKNEHADVIAAGVIDSRPSDTTSRRLSSQERFKLQQECLFHKRHAMKLRRGGEIEAAEAEHKLAKALEAQLEPSSAVEANSLQATRWKDDDMTVEDVIDTGLLSSLKDDTPEPVSIRVSGNPIIDEGRERLEKQIKLEKAKAVRLKRLGKQEEALSTLRQAKILEKKLQSLDSS